MESNAVGLRPFRPARPRPRCHNPVRHRSLPCPSNRPISRRTTGDSALLPGRDARLFVDVAALHGRHGPATCIPRHKPRTPPADRMRPGTNRALHGAPLPRPGPARSPHHPLGRLWRGARSQRVRRPRDDRVPLHERSLVPPRRKRADRAHDRRTDPRNRRRDPPVPGRR